MLFNHDTDLTLRAVSVLINTNRVDGERLGDLDALDEYLDTFGWTGRRDEESFSRPRERAVFDGFGQCQTPQRATITIHHITDGGEFHFQKEDDKALRFRSRARAPNPSNPNVAGSGMTKASVQ